MKNKVQMWVHLVWATKNRQPLLVKSLRKKLCFHIKSEAEKKGYKISIINGVEDHLHCFAHLKPTHTISKLAKDLKGESSRWLNVNYFGGTFEWQRGYGAFSVSPSAWQKVYQYILNQEERHCHQTFDEEFLYLDSLCPDLH